ncbi:MAG: RusA family crossover junction endodeoxyribonuclease [bacterium]|jgi:Holliday junction resolvase RusA-like endonuclease
MSRLEFVVKMQCRTKQRPRATTDRRGNVHSYMTTEYQISRDLLRQELWAAMRSRRMKPFKRGVPLCLYLLIKFKGKGRGDADNLAGFFMDAANGTVWHDDSQIEFLTVDLVRNAGENVIEAIIELKEVNE